MTESVDDLLDDLVEGAPAAVRSNGMAGAGGSLSEGSEEAVGQSAGSGSAPLQGEPERAASDLRGEARVSDAALPSSPRSKDREGTQSNPKGGLPAPPDTSPGAAEARTSSADAERSGPQPRVSAPGQKARRGMARQRERSGRCPMYAPVGTVCKTCGKVHPL